MLSGLFALKFWACRCFCWQDELGSGGVTKQSHSWLHHGLKVKSIKATSPKSVQKHRDMRNSKCQVTVVIWSCRFLRIWLVRKSVLGIFCYWIEPRTGDLLVVEAYFRSYPTPMCCWPSWGEVVSCQTKRSEKKNLDKRKAKGHLSCHKLLASVEPV